MIKSVLDSFGTLRVVGFRSAYWYAVYRIECMSGISRRRTPIRSWEEILNRLPAAALEWDPAHRPPFFFDDPRTLETVLRRIAPRAESGLNSELEAIQKGSFRLWEDDRYDLGFQPDWNRNPLTGRTADSSRHWTATGEQAAGDIKGTWELSRFSVAFRLARLYALSGNERAPEVFWQLVESWLSANPPNAGPQWLSSQEVALRAMAWIFALRAFARSPVTTASRKGRLIAALDAHAHRIEATLAYAKAQNNNHLISEAAGLFTIGLLFPELPDSARWNATGRNLLESTAGQFFPDGGYIQHSINYHRLALQLYLWVMRLAETNGRPFSATMYSCVDHSLELLSKIVDPRTGRASNFGHNDGALFLPLNSCAFEDYRPLLQALSFWRKGTRIWEDGPWDEDALWLLGPEALTTSDRMLRPLVEGEPFPAPDAGLYVMHGRGSSAVIRCVRFHSRPAHADQLHVDLWCQGENIACDAGSYLYGGDPPWRNSLTHAAVHNTVTIDGLDQMHRSGRFGWSTLAQGKGMFLGDREWRGTHDGYLNHRMGHYRSVERWQENVWIVTDDLWGAGSHSVRLHWLMPDYSWKWVKPVLDKPLQVFLHRKLHRLREKPPESLANLKTLLTQTNPKLSDPTADAPDLSEAFRCLNVQTPTGTVSLLLWSDPIAQWNIYRAGERVEGAEETNSPVPAEIRGWRSLRYADKIPAISLAGWMSGDMPARFISIWIPRSGEE